MPNPESSIKYAPEAEKEKLVPPEEIKKERLPSSAAPDGAKPLTSRDKGFQRAREGLGTKDALADKGEQLKLVEELERIEKEEKASLDLIKKLKFGSKEEARTIEVRARFAPKKEAVQKELDKYKTKPTSVESIIEGLKKTAEAGEKTRIASLKKEQERIARLRLELKKGEAAAKPAADLGRFQKIPITPEYKAQIKEWREKELTKEVTEANKKLIEAEDALAEAQRQRPGFFSRLLPHFKISKASTAEIAYQTAFQDKNTPPEELKKLEATATEAMTLKPLTAENTYQNALINLQKAQQILKDVEKTAEEAGVTYSLDSAPKISPPRFTILEKPTTAPFTTSHYVPEIYASRHVYPGSTTAATEKGRWQPPEEEIKPEKSLDAQIEEAEQELNEAESALEKTKQTRPGFLNRLFKKNAKAEALYQTALQVCDEANDKYQRLITINAEEKKHLISHHIKPRRFRLPERPSSGGGPQSGKIW